MKRVAVIPIKLNSERLKDKNIKLFNNGRPLCSYIFESISKVKNIDEIYVYCSDERIMKYIPSNIKFLKRSEELDKNTTTMNEVLQAFSNEVSADIYILTHVTAPFIKAKSFEKAIEKVEEGEFDSAFTVKRVNEFLWKDGKTVNYDLNNIPRTQDLPEIYSETCGFYIFRSELIKKYNRRIGDKPFFLEVDNVEAIDIDDEFDFRIAEAILEWNVEENNE